MNINLTLVLQSIAMMIFVWFCMQFIWPHLLRAIENRRATIASGLAAAEQAERELDEARHEAERLRHEAREQAAAMIDQAGQRAARLVEEAKRDAASERARLKTAAENEIQQAVEQARATLRGEIAGMVVLGAGQVLGKAIDEGGHRALLDDLVAGF